MRPTTLIDHWVVRNTEVGILTRVEDNIINAKKVFDDGLSDEIHEEDYEKL